MSSSKSKVMAVKNKFKRFRIKRGLVCLFVLDVNCDISINNNQAQKYCIFIECTV